MWFYVQRVLIPYEKADAVAHQRPRGNLSDLYPRWLGARELLLHHRNPYGDELRAEIQQGYYGRPLDTSRPNDPKDQQAFAYPLYVVFLLAPFIVFSFNTVRIFFYWLLVLLTAVSVPLWMRALRWKPPAMTVTICLTLTLGSFAAAQGIKLQQLSLLVAGLLAACAACVASGYLYSAGAILALSTIKPQLSWPLVIWLMLWAFSEWRTRRRFVFGFAVVLALLLAGAELILPGWERMFIDALRQYHQYTHNQSILDLLLGFLLGARAGELFGGIAALLCGFRVWKWRTKSADTPEFARALALVLALTVLVVPMFAPYNQVLLLPAIFWLVLERSRISISAVGISIYAIGAFFLVWQWIASLILSITYFVSSPATAQTAWRLPLYSTFALPVFVFSLVVFGPSMKAQVLRGRERTE
jgi:hypothetical protein